MCLLWYKIFYVGFYLFSSIPQNRPAAAGRFLHTALHDKPAGLELPKMLVEPAGFLYQLLVCADLVDLPVAYDNNTIHLHNGGQSVGDDDGGLTFHQPVERFLDKLFGVRVKA